MDLGLLNQLAHRRQRPLCGQSRLPRLDKGQLDYGDVRLHGAESLDREFALRNERGRDGILKLRIKESSVKQGAGSSNAI